MNEEDEYTIDDEILIPTPEFKLFMTDIIRNRCLIREETFNECFNNENGWSTLRQAFVHKSLMMTHYDLLETEGDAVISLVVIEYLREKFPDIVNTEWLTVLKHKLVSGKQLGAMAVKHGLSKFIEYKKDYYEPIFNEFGSTDEERLNSTDFLGMAEDTLEALCGAIKQILNKCTTRGVGYVACFNLIVSFLNELDIITKLQKHLDADLVFDPKTRFKETIEMKKYHTIKGCKLDDSLKVFDLGVESDTPTRSDAIKFYTFYMRNNANQKIIDSILKGTNRYVAFSLFCLTGDPNRKTLVGLAFAKNSSDAKKGAALEGIKTLKNNKNNPIFKPPSDAYKRSPWKPQKKGSKNPQLK